MSKHKKQKQVVYLDTSFYLAHLLGQEQTKSYLSILKQCGLCSSTIMFLEVERNLMRLAREKVISSNDHADLRGIALKDVSLFALKEPTIELCMSNTFPLIQTPRSLDLLHIRTAHWFKHNFDLKYFISLDRTQLTSARELGLAVAE